MPPPGSGLDPKVAAHLDELATPPPPGSPFAVPVPGTEREGRSAIYRHWRYVDKPLLTTNNPDLRTFYELFHDTVRRLPNNKCLGSRPWNPVTKQWEKKYVWSTYAEVAARARNFGSGIFELFREIGLPPGPRGVGLWSHNRSDWQVADLGIMSQSLFSVSLYETLGPDTSEYIIKHAELPCVVTSLPHIPLLLALAPRIPGLKLIISMDPLDAGEPDGMSKKALLAGLAKQHGIQIWSMTDVEELGAKVAHPPRPPRPEDIITINYTSGTTGNPKGVVLTHANCVAAVCGAHGSGHYTHRDTCVSYLPIAHIFGRMIDQVALTEGAAVGYFHGNMLELVDDLKILKPNGLPSVPRLFNRFNQGIRAQTIQAEGIRGAISRRVIETKKASMKLPPGKATNKHLIYDSIWTPKVRAAVGLDNCRAMVSGSAPLDPDVHIFLRAAFGNNIASGYGLTESYAAAACQVDGDFSTGNNGGPLASLEVCLESQPDMEYLATDRPRPRGELLLRGPIMFREYYKNEEETKKTLDSDGWFHTGDIAEFDELGRIRIIDRKKNVLKLSQGEYISPERIENVYLGSCDLLSMAYVHGESSQSNLIGIFGVEPEAFGPFASKILKKTVASDDVAAIKAAAKDPRVVKAVLKQLDDIGRKHKFNGYERVKRCYLDVEPFSLENELLTPTLKLKRPQTARKFKAEIDRMYAEITEEGSKITPKL
ncbi:AMP-binding enzyme [Xylariaceae sp. FL0255]|nr:AMP-binding enzyme [Xylariaceae sp. FL0255]